MKSHKNLSSTLKHLEQVQIIFRANFTYDMKLPQHGNSHLDQTVVQKMCPKILKELSLVDRTKLWHLMKLFSSTHEQNQI